MDENPQPVMNNGFLADSALHLEGDKGQRFEPSSVLSTRQTVSLGQVGQKVNDGSALSVVRANGTIVLTFGGPIQNFFIGRGWG